MQSNELIATLFRQEFSKMVAVISRVFGLRHIELAEDIVGETFLTATETWEQKGIPANPAAWLYAVARQKTLYHFRRNGIFEKKILPRLQAGQTPAESTDTLDFSDQNIQDSRLQMMFAVCNPAIAAEAQIGLALRVLCGFGIDEIAEAFLTNKETINKRLFRAKEKLRTEQIELEMPPEHVLLARLDNVLHILYLLFNEGYYSSTQNRVLRKDFCLEALRLGLLLTEFEKTDLPKTNALLALMCFHTSRFEARQNDAAGFILYEHQDETLWDQDLIRLGSGFLEKSAQGDAISSYHLEAGIAFWHCRKDDAPGKWAHILHHYDLLLQLNYSPVVALNRVYAFYKVHGKAAALPEAEALQLHGNHFYFTLLGELFTGTDSGKARMHFRKALSLARTAYEKQLIQEKIDSL